MPDFTAIRRLIAEHGSVHVPYEETVAMLAEIDRLRDVLRQVGEYAEVHPPSVTAALAREALEG